MSPLLYGARITLTRDGVGVSGGTLLVAVATLRLRSGVAGASGFLKTSSPIATLDVSALPALGFFDFETSAEASAEASAERFLLVELERSGVVARFALATLLERRRDIVNECLASIQLALLGYRVAVESRSFRFSYRSLCKQPRHNRLDALADDSIGTRDILNPGTEACSLVGVALAYYEIT